MTLIVDTILPSPKKFCLIDEVVPLPLQWLYACCTFIYPFHCLLYSLCPLTTPFSYYVCCTIEALIWLEVSIGLPHLTSLFLSLKQKIFHPNIDDNQVRLGGVTFVSTRGMSMMGRAEMHGYDKPPYFVGHHDRQLHIYYCGSLIHKNTHQLRKIKMKALLLDSQIAVIQLLMGMRIPLVHII